MFGTGREEVGKGNLAAIVGRHLLHKAEDSKTTVVAAADGGGRKLLDPLNFPANGDLIMDPQKLR